MQDSFPRMDAVAASMVDHHSTGGAISSQKDSNLPQDTAIETRESCLNSIDVTQEDTILNSASVLGRKRKQYSSGQEDFVDDSLSKEDSLDTDRDGDSHYVPSKSARPKRPRLENNLNTSDRSLLPMEIWHHILSFLDPKNLGVLLRVNRTFYSFLTSKEHDPLDASSFSSSSAHGVLKAVSSNAIWSYARKTFCPGMPRPLANMSEVDMWRLICTVSCEYCGKRDSAMHPSATSSPAWERGPGINGVRIFWPFGIRTCSQCFRKETKKDVEVVLSSIPTLLLPGLSFVLLSPSMHMIPSVVLRSNDMPADLQLTKYYSNSDMDNLMHEFNFVQSLGPAALEEWIKGLEGKGKGKMADAARWEQWENSGGLHELRMRWHGKTANTRLRSNFSPRSPEGLSLSPVSLPAYGVPYSVSPGHINDSRNRRSGSGPGRESPTDSATRYQQSRGERSLRDVDEAKAARRAEIERRCLALNPPLTAAVLSHMDSFSAAIQIPHELTDKDWDYLKPRLLAQRELAEKKEIDRLKESQLLQARTEERRQQEARSKQEKESLDHEWEDAQRLIRDQIMIYADETITNNWNSGKTLSKDKCAQFAAEVLMHVRTRFYAHIEEEDALARASGVAVKTDSPDGPPTRKLILENMKWIFDHKVKPLTEKFTKELFLCNGCENTSRYYGFEGVVQHYAAKHTTTLSSGNVIVFWRAEWPEKPPFHPNPNAAKALLHASAQGGFGQPHGYPRQQGMPGVYMATPEQRHCILPDSNPSSRAYGRSPFRSPYTNYMQGPFQPPSPRTSPYYSGYVFPPPSPAMEPATFDQSSAYNSPYYAHVVPVNHQAHLPQTPHPYPSPAYGSTSPANPGLPYKVPHAGSRNVIAHHKSSASSENYQHQLDSMARVAREVWNATSGIKDLPNSVRAHVLIYHVAKTTQHQFNVDASIALFANGLNNHPQMKPMRGLNGLVCKYCRDESGSDLNLRMRNSKSYPFSALLSHFQSMHMEHVRNDTVPIQEETRDPDWKTDMIALPDLLSLKSIVQNPGMDEFKLRIIAQALPEAFASPLPALPPETFITKRSPAIYHAYVAERQPAYHSPTLRHVEREEFITAPRAREVPLEDVVPTDAISERTQFSRDHISGRDSANASLHDDSRSHSSRGTHYVAQSPRAVIVRRGSPRYIRLQDDWVYREEDAEELSSGHPDRYYIPVSTRSAMSDRSDYAYRQVPSEQYEAEVPMQQRVERQPTINRQSGVQASDGSATFSNDVAPLMTDHEDSRSNAGDQSAAEKFLNSFVPGQEMQRYQSQSSNSDIRNDPASIPIHARPQRRIMLADDITDRAGVTYYSTSDDAWKQQQQWSSPGVIRAHETARESRSDWATAQRGRSPEVVQLRYGRKPSGTMEPKVPHSRFDRYEAVRQETHQPSSRSPSIVKEELSRDALPVYYEEQDPRLQSRLAPQQHSGDPSVRYARLEQESSMSSQPRRNVSGYRTAGVTREPAYYDDAPEY